MEATPTAHASGWPLYVRPPAKNLSWIHAAIGSRTDIAPSGT